jgi:hypothetical protein
LGRFCAAAKVTSSSRCKLKSSYCTARLPYVCVRAARGRPEVTTCPLGYSAYRGTCLAVNRTSDTYDGAVASCARIGGVLESAKHRGQYDFLTALAKEKGKI